MTSGGKWKRRKAAGRVEQAMAGDSGSIDALPGSVRATVPSLAVAGAAITYFCVHLGSAGKRASRMNYQTRNEPQPIAGLINTRKRT